METPRSGKKGIESLLCTGFEVVQSEECGLSGIQRKVTIYHTRQFYRGISHCQVAAKIYSNLILDRIRPTIHQPARGKMVLDKGDKLLIIEEIKKHKKEAGRYSEGRPSTRLTEALY